MTAITMKLIRNARDSLELSWMEAQSALDVAPVGTGSSSASRVIAIATTASEKKIRRSAAPDSEVDAASDTRAIIAGTGARLGTPAGNAVARRCARTTRDPAA